MSIRWTAVSVALLLLAGCQQGKPEKSALESGNAATIAPAAPKPTVSSIKPGVYGDVNYVEEAGDLVGVELQVPDKPGQPIEITLCEGDCNSVVRAPFVVKGNAIEFTYRDEGVDQDGKPVEISPIHFRLEQRGRDVMLINQPISDDVPPELLKRQSKRDALDYAAEQMKEQGQ